ncbi:OmpA family protein [Mucilaginibacter sp.]|jgi:outer membrane protein OmpA-like peptidoglycan-associated protein|uniref:OmpA family protein n=1 Tax=Mucilaginibacter sp. TaxID=1882438 RepID=UPI002C5295F7|nr:OmpA family protein [Mucilaginibacter sp.]HTI60570.1 OmpA family protein [Mucilaginibacter sp.]
MQDVKRCLLCIIMLGAGVALMLAMGCHARNKAQRGAAIGAGTGGTVGAFIGKSAGNTAMGAIIGGAVGGTAGAFVGKNMDRQAAELKETIPGASVLRVGEGIIVKFDSGILFDTGKADLKPAAKTNLQNLAGSLQKNNATNVLVIGHTDSQEGSGANDIVLSKQRASAVKNYLAANSIDTLRLTTMGKGETEPIADNKTAAGRAQNRRVEIVIIANEHMRKQAAGEEK